MPRGKLTDARRDICERYITGSSYRIVTMADADRDRGAAAYGRPWMTGAAGAR